MASGNNPMIIKVGPVGSYHGAELSMDPTGVTRIVKIDLWESDYVYGFSVDFERNGRVENFFLGSRRGRQQTITLQQSEYITGLRGQMRKDPFPITRKLIIRTNVDIYGPYGASGEYDFELPTINTATMRGEIVGFFGSVGTVLDSIGVYIKVSTITSGGGGGANVGGDATGGNASGGAATGGSAAGGGAKGNVAIGGTATGGDAKGDWISTGGDATGGNAAGTEKSTGGNATGGGATGGNAAGGNASGGNASGGCATGGTGVGGNATGDWSSVGGSAVGGNAE